MRNRIGTVQSVLLAAIVAVGFATLYGIVFACCYGLWQERTRARRTRENLQITTEGIPVISSSDGIGVTHYRLLDGRAFSGHKDWLRGVRLGANSNAAARWSELSWHHRVLPVASVSQPAVYWYFIHTGKRAGKGYFAGYDSRTQFCVGYIGPGGFQINEPPESRQFSVDGRQIAFGSGLVSTAQNAGHYGVYPAPGSVDPLESTAFLHSAGHVYRVNFRNETIDVDLDVPNLLSMQGFWRRTSRTRNEHSADQSGAELLLALRTPDRVIIRTADARDSRVYMLPAELQDVDFLFYELPEGRALVQLWDHGEIGRSYSADLVWLTEDGDVVRREEDVVGWSSAHGHFRTESLVLAAGVPAPIAVTAMAVYSVLQELQLWGAEDDYSSALVRSLAETWPALLVIALFSAGLTVVCDRWQRRYGQPRSYVWLGFVFLLGLPGLMGYLFHRRWPLREACPACGRKASRDREVCSSCGAEFPRPELKGTEVFAP